MGMGFAGNPAVIEIMSVIIGISFLTLSFLITGFEYGGWLASIFIGVVAFIVSEILINNNENKKLNKKYKIDEETEDELIIAEWTMNDLNIFNEPPLDVVAALKRQKERDEK